MCVFDCVRVGLFIGPIHEQVKGLERLVDIMALVLYFKVHNVGLHSAKNEHWCFRILNVCAKLQPPVA